MKKKPIKTRKRKAKAPEIVKKGVRPEKDENKIEPETIKTNDKTTPETLTPIPEGYVRKMMSNEALAELGVEPEPEKEFITEAQLSEGIRIPPETETYCGSLICKLVQPTADDKGWWINCRKAPPEPETPNDKEGDHG